jgi:flagellar hook assembly protein FlgD
LWPCFPNPFNASTVIRYDLPSASFVRLEIYNALGQKIKTLMSAKESAGEHRIQWDATNDAGQPAPSGVYLIQLQAGKETRTHKVTVVR